MHNADWAAPRFIAFKAMPCTQSLPPDSERRKFSRAPALPTALSVACAETPSRGSSAACLFFAPLRLNRVHSARVTSA